VHACLSVCLRVCVVCLRDRKEQARPTAVRTPNPHPIHPYPQPPLLLHAHTPPTHHTTTTRIHTQVFAGGTKAVSQNETLRFPQMHRSGVCGDAFGDSHWSKPGPVMANYTAGATIDVDVIFAQNHLGRYQVRLCPLDAQDEEKDCTDLQRADGMGRAVYLPMTPGWHGVTSGFVAPLEEDEAFTKYQMPTVGRKDGCAAWCVRFGGLGG
jgi:hypothetical protein